MANYNLTNQPISASFQQLLQKNTDTGKLVDGTGSVVDSLEITGSVTASFFKGDGSALTNVPSVLPAGVVSGSSQLTSSYDARYALSGSGVTSIIAGTNIIIDQSTGDVTIQATTTASADWNSITSKPAGLVSGSSQVSDLTGSLLETASVVDATITFTKGDASQFSIEVNNVTSSLQTQDVFVNVKNVSGGPINKGIAVHATGVTGENINVIKADSSISANMPAIGLLETTLNNNATGRAIISGRLKNIDTSGLTAGEPVYVNGSGILTSNKPTGSDLIQNIGVAGKINATEGEIIVQGAGRSNDVPNISTGYFWVGNGDGVATATSTGSFAKTNVNNTFTGTQNFTNISVSGTGSFGYIESVTGSAKIIGDAYIILNNDTPTERYAGIKVIDSGSTQATASLQFDGQTNDWFYEYTASGDPENFGVVMFGPEYATKGSPTYVTNNTIPKGNGGHHLNDSSITDSGTQVTINNPLDVQGNITTTGTVDGIDIQTLQGEVTANSASIASLTSGTGSYAVLNGGNNFTGDQVIEGAALITGSYTTAGYNLETSRLLLTGSNTALSSERPQVKIISPNNSNDENEIWAFTNNTSAQIYAIGYENGSAKNYAQILANNSDSTYLYLNQPATSSAFFWLPPSGDFGQGALMQLDSVYGGINNTTYTGIKTNGDIETNLSAMSGTNYIKSTVNGDLSGVSIELNDSNNAYNSMWAQTLFQMKNTNVGGIGISPNISQTGVSGYAGPGIYGIVDDSTAYEIIRLEDSGSFSEGTIDFRVPLYVSTATTLSGSVQFNSSLTISGSTSTEVAIQGITSNTASVDFGDTSMFELELASGATTHLDATNIGKGQTINILVKQPAGATGSLEFSPKFLQPTGSEYTATNSSNSEDILTLVTFNDTSKIYVANVKQLV